MIKFPIAQQKAGSYKKTFLFFLLLWFLINLVQAIFTEVISDEAYYGMYGRYLDWGFYDHPPMVAVLIKISSLIFSGNLGIRFMTILIQLGTIFLIWKTIDIREHNSQSVIYFFIICASISLFSAYGIITTPDAPLLFFTALFFFSYKRYIDDQKWATILLLSISMAGLIYSKYQAVLVIGFLILSDLKLLKSYKFWIAGILALLLLSPHIFWQIKNDFPSFQYHLVDRSDSFRWKFFIEYLPNQMAVFNPFTLGAIFFILVKYKPAGQFNRSLYFQIIGFIVFFWLTSFRGHVEPHWTIACSIPMIILLSEKSSENTSLAKYVRICILPSLLLLLAVRIILVTNSELSRSGGFAGKEEKYRSIESVAKDLPVVFTGSFQKPSLYTFFTGKEATVISSIYSRQTQFDIWQFERKYQNKPAFICIDAEGKSQSYNSGFLQFSGFKTDSLQTVNRMKIDYDITEKSFYTGDSINVTFTLQNTYNNYICFSHPDFPVKISLVLIRGEEKYVLDVSLSQKIDTILQGETIKRKLVALIPDIPGNNYHVALCLNNIFGPSLNSRFTKINIENDD